MNEAEPGDPVVWEPPCMVVNCPIHPQEARLPARNKGAVSLHGRGGLHPGRRPSQIPRRSKLEVANERNRKLLKGEAT